MTKDHYVAQTYLKRFSNQNGMLHAYSKSDGKTFPCWPADVCHEWDGDSNPILTHPSLLGDFRKIWERHWTPSVENLLSNSISSKDKLAISGYMANLMTCTPTWQRVSQKIYEQQSMGTLSFSKRMGEKYGTMENELIDGLTMLEKGELKLKFDSNYIKTFAIRSLFDMALQTYNQDWEIISNNTNHLFVTSDNPVAIDYFGPGSRLTRFLPITPHLCLCVKYNQILRFDPEDFLPNLKLAPRGKIQRTECSTQGIKHINRLVIQCAENLIFSSEELPIISTLAAKYAKHRVDVDYKELSGKEENSIYQMTSLRVKEMR